MKNIKYLVILLVVSLLVPVAVFAADEEVVAENPEATDNKVPVCAVPKAG